MDKIVFIASRWGAKEGGINAFNYDLISAITHYFHENIICIVEKIEHGDSEDARKHGVILIETHGRFNAANITKILSDSGYNNISCWIGHDIITGNEAIECSEIYNRSSSSPCLSGVIHHMRYLSYYTAKTNDASATFEKSKMQKDIFTKCDLVFAVGPFLKNSAENFLKEGGIIKEVIELIPGLANLSNADISKPFKGIAYGRLGDSDEIVKQGTLAVAAFSKMCGNEELTESELTIIGLDSSKIKEKQEELKNIGIEYSGQLCVINGLPYIDRNEIYSLLRTQSVSMMLSTHEGFGLAGWEAISAEVPLILSKDTGLYEFIDSTLGGSGTGCIFSVKITTNFKEDVDVVTKSLLEIKKDVDKAKKNARKLKEQLKEFTWQATADQLITHVKLNLNLIKKGLEIQEDIQGNYVKINGKVSSSEEYKTKEASVAVLAKPNIVTHNFGHEIYYSTSTFISHAIAETYYNDLHYVWCTAKFNPARTNPASANPYEIYKKFMKEVEAGIGGPTITKHIVGLINGASKKRQQGIITEEIEKEIVDMIYAAKEEVKYFKPIIYIIPATKVKGCVKLVPQSKKAGLLSQEFLIESTGSSMFEIIDLS